MGSHRKGETGNANLPEDARESHDRHNEKIGPRPWSPKVNLSLYLYAKRSAFAVGFCQNRGLN